LIIVAARFAPFQLQHVRVFFAFCEVRPMIGPAKTVDHFGL